jgi:sodium-dependent dicarboxylate transporter 2/3/5
MHEEELRVQKTLTQKIGLALGPILFFLALFLDLHPGKPVVTRMAAVAVLMATWWITDAIPLAATALIPMVLYPLLGILTAKATAPIYMNDTIVLFLGGFMIALTMEKWNLHRRIALWIIGRVGGGPSRIVLGFMGASAFLSMWISNTATAIMMMPIGLAVILKMEDDYGAKATHAFSAGLMLAIAYGASVGGIATLVGTPPNLSFARIFQITFPQAPPITFGQWLIMGLPLSVIMVTCIWLAITKIFFRSPKHLKADKRIIESEYEALGPMSFEERVVLLIFALTAILWVFRSELKLGLVTIPGWSQLLPHPRSIGDSTVAVFMASLMFLIPTRSRNAPTATIMGANVFRRIPWHIVLLFGGGFALAQGFQTTGLSTVIGSSFAGLAGVAPVRMILFISSLLTFLTELTSNTATTEMVLPVLASMAVAMHLNPLLLMLPATLCASCAFMMPVATPPNAIVFGGGRISISEMARVGVVLNILGVLVVTAVVYFIAMAVFAIDPGVFPEWAKSLGTPGGH